MLGVARRALLRRSAVLVLVASFFAPGGPTGGGWTLYPPQVILSGTPGGQGAGIILMLLSGCQHQPPGADLWRMI